MTMHCQSLNNWIVFWPEHVGPCCISLDIEPPKMLFEGGTFSAETYQQWIEEVCRLNQEPDGPCSGCRNLVSTNNADAKLQIETITLGNFYVCNAKCSYCTSWVTGQTEKPKYELMLPVKSLIDNGLLSKNAHFYWSGGEATILPEFARLFQLIRSNGFSQTVLTSAIKFSPELAEGLVSNDAKTEISLDSGTPETYEVFKGRPVFSTVANNILKYASDTTAAKNIALKYIMSNQTCADEDINGFIEICKKAHIVNVILSPEIYENKNQVTAPDTINQMVKFFSSCIANGLSPIINYSLFTDEYRSMVQNQLATTTFITKGNLVFYKVSGWSYPEGDFTWTDGQKSVLKVKVPTSHIDLVFKINAAPFLNKVTASQQLILVINGQEVGRVNIITNDWVEYALKIPKELTTVSDLNIELYLPDAVDVQGGENRMLGLAVKSIEIDNL